MTKWKGGNTRKRNSLIYIVNSVQAVRHLKILAISYEIIFIIITSSPLVLIDNYLYSIHNKNFFLNIL